MTSQKDQIQALITDIDGVLQKTTPRLPWVVSGEITQQRQVLERVRNYLVAFQRRQFAGEGFGQAEARPDLLAHDIYYQAPPSYSPTESQSAQQAYGQNEANAQQMLQAIVQEMGSLRSNLMQPLQEDLEVLRQQREALTQEIRQLEAQRQGYAGQLPGQQQLIAEFLQALMSRLQETLPQQVAQTLGSSNQQALPYANNLALAGAAPSVISTSDAPSQGLGNIQVSQASSDELLIRLDSTLSIVFESLQRNVQAYQESLSQGLDKMHSMGQQGEVMFSALISHLAQQLGRETSSYLQPAADQALGRSPSIPSSKQQSPTPAVNPALFGQPDADAALQPFALPFPGTEISDSFGDVSTVSSTSVSVPSVDSAIDSWLRSASGASAPSDVASDVDVELAALNLEGFDLSQLAAQDVNALLELDANLLGTNLPPQPLLSPVVPAAPETLSSNAPTVEDTADIDAALKLLEQLSSELQEQPSSVADADAQIDRMLNSPTASAEDASTVSIPDDARDELDEFYESLFGTNAIAASTEEASGSVASSATEVSSQQTAEPVAEFTIELEPAIALPDTQPFDAQPSDVSPISTLPAEAQAPADTLAEPTVPSVPSASTASDPTLGWLPVAPLDTPAAEPEIPVALLEDELVNGWDFADAESALSEPATTPVTDNPPATDDLLSGWDLVVDDRAPFQSDASPSLSTDTLADFFGESEPLAAASSSDVLSESTTAPATDNSLATDDLLSGWDLTVDDAVDARAPLQSDAPSSLSTDTLADFFGESQPMAAEGSADVLSEPATAPATDDDLLSGWDLAVDARASLQSDAPSSLSTDTLADFFSENQPLAAEANPNVAPPLVLTPPNQQDKVSEDITRLENVSEDEISSLDDLFGESEFGSDMPAEGQPLEPTITAASTASAPLQPLVTPSASSRRSSEGSSTQIPPTDLAEGYLSDARYTPASPEEDLLSLAEPVEALDSELWLDENTLSRLSEDLFNLEEVINESSLSFSSDSNANTSSLFSDAVAPSEPAPPSTEATSTVSEWSDGLLDDFAVDESAYNDVVRDDFALNEFSATPSATPPATFSLESEALSSIADPPGTFVLEGMDDLFANTPVAPPVSPILPPVPPIAMESPASFTLEGMDDLFGDAPTADQTFTADSASTAELPFTLEAFTLEGEEDLFADAPGASTGSLPIDSASAAEPAFTLEGVDDLFADTPVVNTLPEAAQPLPFTLEGVDELFADMPPVPAKSPALDVPPAVLSAGSLPVPSEAITGAPIQADPVAAFTFEQVGDLFIELPETDASTVAAPNVLPTESPALTDPFTLEQIGDLFVEVPTEEPLLNERSTETPAVSPEPSAAPFTLEQMGDLFIETPASPEPALESSAAPFTLEQMGDLFAETPSETSEAQPVADPPAILQTSQPAATSEPSALEQAFASLMGSFDDPQAPLPPAPGTTESTTETPEKKKGMS
ncbi:hypothetical protein H6F86_28130 [Phormidium sp. FACHB-592]|uniref:Uncharacterized protein n=1 Tax=Stenomitos frigidus AS-A4 TaxID=2933935 RepID=A0ABV0KCV2_9CYAN|nr:hypothetical protein [Phormidium sp. FACHB-592]MBD2077685.1 hypothetical protein [Phormidium sp. FACHB-592]